MNCKICGLSDQARTEIETLLANKLPYRQIIENIGEKYAVKLNLANLNSHKNHVGTRNADPLKPKITIENVDITGMPNPVAIEVVSNALKKLVKL